MMILAKVTFNTSRAISNLKRNVRTVKKSKAIQEQIGKFLVNRIKFEARKGTPLNSKRNFPSLSSATKEQRRYLEKFNKTNKTYSSGRSNLTFTGQLINAIGFSVKSNKLLLFVMPKRRKGYKTGPRSRQKRPPNNEQLAGFLKEIGFVLFNKKGLESDPKIRKRVNNIVRRALRKILKSN